MERGGHQWEGEFAFDKLYGGRQGEGRSSTGRGGHQWEREVDYERGNIVGERESMPVRY